MFWEVMVPAVFGGGVAGYFVGTIVGEITSEILGIQPKISITANEYDQPMTRKTYRSKDTMKRHEDIVLWSRIVGIGIGIVVAIILVFVFAGAKEPAIEPPEFRTWTALDGSFKIEGKYVQTEVVVTTGDGTLTLKKRDGSFIEVPLEKLVPEDKAYIEDRNRKGEELRRKRR